MASLWLIFAVFLTGVTAYRMIRTPQRSKPPLPPGPTPEPLLGHYRVVPEDAAFKRYAEWAKEYSMILEQFSPFYWPTKLTIVAPRE